MAGPTPSAPASPAESEAQALVASSSEGGVASAKVLAAKLAALTPAQRSAVMNALAPKYLNALQLGQLHVALDAILKQQAQAAQSAQREAALMAQAGYYRGADGQLHFTPERQQQVCRNYTAMMRSNSQINEALTFGFGGATLGSFGWRALDSAMGTVMGKSIGVVGAIGSMTTQTLSHAPPPPGCP